MQHPSQIYSVICAQNKGSVLLLPTIFWDGLSTQNCIPLPQICISSPISMKPEDQTAMDAVFFDNEEDPEDRQEILVCTSFDQLKKKHITHFSHTQPILFPHYLFLSIKLSNLLKRSSFRA